MENRASKKQTKNQSNLVFLPFTKAMQYILNGLYAKIWRY